MKLIGILLAATLGLFVSTGASAKSYGVLVMNNSGVAELTQVLVKEKGSSDWGGDLYKESQALNPKNENFRLMLFDCGSEPCIADIKMTFKVERGYFNYFRNNANLSTARDGVYKVAPGEDKFLEEALIDNVERNWDPARMKKVADTQRRENKVPDKELPAGTVVQRATNTVMITNSHKAAAESAISGVWIREEGADRGRNAIVKPGGILKLPPGQSIVIPYRYNGCTMMQVTLRFVDGTEAIQKMYNCNNGSPSALTWVLNDQTRGVKVRRASR